MLSFMQNDSTREKLLDKAAEHYGYLRNTNSRQMILEKAKQINHLMKNDRLGYAEARERFEYQLSHPKGRKP
jgi:hypothetical protein